jgi:hemerythrin-like metal-binding protein
MYIPTEFTWKDTMATGVSEIDSQHKYLINFINELGYSINKKYDSKDIAGVLKVMKFYAGQHFGKEEECMARYQCPIAGTNEKAHAAFVKKLQEYQKEYELSGGSNELAVRIHKALTDWTMNHIMKIDTRLFPYTQSTTLTKT